MKIFDMNKTTKVILGIAVPLTVFGGYWFVYRNREPLLDLDETDWTNNVAVIKFGRNNKSISLGNNGEMNAGSTYSDKYKVAMPLNWKPGEKVIVPPPKTVDDMLEREKSSYEMVDFYLAKKELTEK